MTDYFADRIKPFKKYAFAEIDRAKGDMSKKMKLVDFGVGDPRIPTPKEIQGSLVAGLTEMDAHMYPSYNGNERFRKSAATYILNRFRTKVDMNSEILTVIGTKEGIAHLPLAILNPGDKAAYPDPSYPVYKAGIAFAGGEPIIMDLKPENNWLPDLKKLPEETKMVWLNYPNNPTGQIAPKSFWEMAVQRAREKKFLLVNDASYCEIYHQDKPTGPLAVGGKDVALEFHSLSKSFSMCGWRIGFAVGNSNVISALGTLKKNIDSGVFTPIQEAGKTALDNCELLIPSIRKLYKRRMNILRAELENIGLEVCPSPATFYLWVKIPPNFTSEEFAKKLIEEIGIVVLPGSFMGRNGEGYVRFSLTLSDRYLELGLQRLRELRLR